MSNAKYPTKPILQIYSETCIKFTKNLLSISKARLTMVYKILNGFVILEPTMMPKLSLYRPMRQCNEAKVGIDNQLLEPHARLDVTKNTFFFATPKLWNNFITSKQANAPRVDAFQQHFKKS